MFLIQHHENNYCRISENWILYSKICLASLLSQWIPFYTRKFNLYYKFNPLHKCIRFGGGSIWSPIHINSTYNSTPSFLKMCIKTTRDFRVTVSDFLWRRHLIAGQKMLWNTIFSIVYSTFCVQYLWIHKISWNSENPLKTDK